MLCFVDQDGPQGAQSPRGRLGAVPASLHPNRDHQPASCVVTRDEPRQFWPVAAITGDSCTYLHLCVLQRVSVFS